jgi:predicted unusual protein kinase regulating ubiquinone biosynthesis (AarF/ABC1/UbiB family)
MPYVQVNHHKPTNVPVVPQKSNVQNTLKFLLNYKWRSSTTKDKTEVAKWTKAQLIDLGPTFIKIGQFISTRSDIFDKEMINELKTLQDKTPVFSTEVVKNIISEELGRPYTEVYADFDDTPLASASISQVHRAKLVENGNEVVVKVQRPYIKNYFDRDFTTLKMIMSVGGLSNDRAISDSRMLLDDCYNYLYEELSFKNELSHLKTFREMLKGSSSIVVPRPYSKLSTSRILTMEYVPSVKVTESASNPELATVLMECFFKQVLEHGIIHADPHPGNIGLTKDGKIVLYDFGQVTTLDSVFIDNVRMLLFAVYEKDVVATTDLLVKSKAIIMTKSLDNKTLQPFIGQVMKYFETLDVKEFQLSMLESDMGIDLPFKINPNLVMVFRSLSLMEGICKKLDPTFSYYKVINVMMQDTFFDFDYLDHRARKDLGMLFDTKTNSKMESIQTVIEESNNKYNKAIDSAQQKYQKLFILFVAFSVFDIEQLPKSVMMIIGFIYLILNVK